jgi:hypothetical protein
MNKNERQKIDREFDAADAAIARAVTAFTNKIERMSGRWVHPKYFIERTLLVLCDEMTKIIDDPRYVHLHGEATLKLSNALADYGDSLWEHR